MFSQRIFLWIATSLLVGSFCAVAAMAEVHRPEAYEKLTSVELAPGHAPRLINGVSDLSVRESRHTEKLPMQLSGAMKKIKKAKYAPLRRKQGKTTS